MSLESSKGNNKISQQLRKPELRKDRPNYLSDAIAQNLAEGIGTLIRRVVTGTLISRADIQTNFINQQEDSLKDIEDGLVADISDPNENSFGSFISDLVREGNLPAAIVSEDASGRFLASVYKVFLNKLKQRLGSDSNNIPVISFVSSLSRESDAPRHARHIVANLKSNYSGGPILYVTDVIRQGGSIKPFLEAFFEHENLIDSNHMATEGRGSTPSRGKPRLAVLSTKREFRIEDLRNPEKTHFFRDGTFNGLRVFGMNYHLTGRSVFRAVERTGDADRHSSP